MIHTPSTEHTSHTTPHWGWAAAIVAMIALSISLRYALPIKDGDIWFHLLYGEYFWQNKTLIADHTLFSWTPSTNETLYCTWLPDIFLYLLYKTGELTALFSFRYFCISLLVVECYYFARKLNIARHPLTWLISLLTVHMSYTGIVAKPEIFSFVFMSLLCWNWWHIRLNGDNALKYCYLIPVIMLIWVNSHGGFVFGVAFLVCAASGELLNVWTGNANALPTKTRKHLIFAFILTCCSLFLTPYGYQYLYQVFSFFIPSQENMSYVNKVLAYGSPFNPHDNDTLGFVRQAYISLGILIFLYLKNLRTVEWSSLLANLLFAFLYTQFYRSTFYWPPVFLFTSLTLLSNRNLELFSLQKTYLSKLLVPALTVCIAGYLTGSTLYKAKYYPEVFCWMGFGISDLNPVYEANYIKENYPTARIGNTSNTGSYLLWKIWPDNKNFIDARQFPHKRWSDEYWNVFHTDLAVKQPEHVSQFLKKYPCDIWLVEYQHLTMQHWFMLSPDWNLAFYGKIAAVFVRKDIPIPKSTSRFGADLHSLKNYYTTIVLFEWAFRCRQWEAADKILNRMQTYFTHPDQQRTTRQLERALQQAKKSLIKADKLDIDS